MWKQALPAVYSSKKAQTDIIQRVLFAGAVAQQTFGNAQKTRKNKEEVAQKMEKYA